MSIVRRPRPAWRCAARSPRTSGGCNSIAKARMPASSGGLAAPTRLAPPRPHDRPIPPPPGTAPWRWGPLSLLGREEQGANASPYFVIESSAAIEEQEKGTWATLRSLEGMKTIPPAMLWGFTEALTQARMENYRTRRTTARALQSASVLGIRPARPRRSPADLKLG